MLSKIHVFAIKIKIFFWCFWKVKSIVACLLFLDGGFKLFDFPHLTF